MNDKSIRDAGLRRKELFPDPEREFYDLLESGPAPPREQPGGGLPDDVLDGISVGLRVALGFRETGAGDPRVRPHAS